MNILYICHRIPYPPNKGDKIRSFNEIKHLSKKHNISLACLVDNKKDLIHIGELKKYCTTVDYDVINPKWQKIKSLMYLFSRRPLSIQFFYSKKLQRAIDYRASSIKFDAVFTFSSPMAEYIFKSKALDVQDVQNVQDVRDVRTIRTSVATKQFKHFERAERLNTSNSPRLIMDFVDVDSDKWRMYSESSSFPRSVIYKNEWMRLMAYEKKIGERFNVSVFVSDAEVELFKSFAPHVNAISIPNGVDFEYFGNVRNVRTNEVVKRAKRLNNSNISNKRSNRTIRLSRASVTIKRAERSGKSVDPLTSYPVNQLKNKQANRRTGEQANILFTGAMDYFPNEDGVLYFCKSIWPLIKKGLPHAKFFIVGNNPSGRIRTISKRDSDVIVTGYVNDIRDYLSMANIFVAPLRIARGVQNKVLEAMAAGLPVVATPQAVQGIGCNGGGFVFIEESAERFAERTIELAGMRLKDNIIIKREVLLRQRFDWTINLEKLEKLTLENKQ